MNQKNKFKGILINSRGFSLLEVLLGISVFMIGMLGVTALNISSLKSNTFSGNMSEAVVIGGSKLEELKTIDFDDDDLAAGDHFQDDDDNGLPDSVGKNGIYAVYWNVAADDPLPEKTKTVNVTVEWSMKDVKRSMSMSTIIIERI